MGYNKHSPLLKVSKKRKETSISIHLYKT